MKIPRTIYEQMLEHAREEAPNECCGIVGGKDGEATTLYRATNAEHSPLRYTLDPNDLFRITFREIPENDEEMLGDLPLPHREPGLSLADRHQPRHLSRLDLPDPVAGRG